MLQMKGLKLFSLSNNRNSHNSFPSNFWRQRNNNKPEFSTALSSVHNQALEHNSPKWKASKTPLYPFSPAVLCHLREGFCSNPRWPSPVQRCHRANVRTAEIRTNFVLQWSPPADIFWGGCSLFGSGFSSFLRSCW